MIMEEIPVSFVAATPLSREHIMAATARCLRDVGYDATTIRRIADMLGCAVGSIYRYFKDKRDLLDGVAQAALEPVAVMIEAGGSVADGARLYRDLVARDPALYRLLFWLHAVGPAGGGHEPGGNNGRRLPGIIDRIITGWARRLGDRPLAERCWMMVHGALMLGMDSDAMIDQLREAVDGSPAGAAKEALSLSRRSRGATLSEPATALHSDLPPDSPPDLTPVVVRTVPAAREVGEMVVEEVEQVEEPVEDVVLL